MKTSLLTMDQAARAGLTETSYATCRAAFEEFMAAGCITRLLNDELQELRDNKVADRLSWNAGQYVIDANDRYSLHLAKHTRPPAFLYSATSIGMASPIGPGTVAYDRYRLPSHWCSEVFDSTIRPRFVEHATAKHGDVVEFHRGDIIDFKFSGDAVLLKFFSADFDSVMWSFDRNSFEPLNAYSANMHCTIYTYMAEALTEIGGERAVPGLEHLSTHPVHYVRWKAVQMLGRLSKTSAMTALERASDDLHPHIRNAARRTLANLHPIREDE